MTAERWIVTEHAACRYVGRINPQVSAAWAMGYLYANLPRATLQEECTIGGQQRWLLPDGEAVIVAKVDLDENAHVAVTVLRPGELYDVDTTRDVLEAYKRATRVRFEPLSVDLDPPPSSSSKEAVFRDKYVKAIDAYNRLRAMHGNLCASVEKLIPKALVTEINTLLGAIASQQDGNSVARARIVSVQKLEKQERHIKMLEDVREFHKEMLRSIVSALLNGANTEDVLRIVRERAPQFLTDAFVHPERYTKEERRAAHCAAKREARQA